jgi:hypothetical protein
MSRGTILPCKYGNSDSHVFPSIAIVKPIMLFTIFMTLALISVRVFVAFVTLEVEGWRCNYNNFVAPSG